MTISVLSQLGTLQIYKHLKKRTEYMNTCNTAGSFATLISNNTPSKANESNSQDKHSKESLRALFANKIRNLFKTTDSPPIHNPIRNKIRNLFKKTDSPPIQSYETCVNETARMMTNNQHNSFYREAVTILSGIGLYNPYDEDIGGDKDVCFYKQTEISFNYLHKTQECIITENINGKLITKCIARISKGHDDLETVKKFFSDVYNEILQINFNRDNLQSEVQKHFTSLLESAETHNTTSEDTLSAIRAYRAKKDEYINAFKQRNNNHLE